jgi:hypothetical protein
LQFAVFFQELLALGERIGHVSTGLSEEKVMGGLKQWKYLHIPLEVEPPTGVEPCCICQVIQKIVFSLFAVSLMLLWVANFSNCSE